MIIVPLKTTTPGKQISKNIIKIKYVQQKYEHLPY